MQGISLPCLQCLPFLARRMILVDQGPAIWPCSTAKISSDSQDRHRELACFKTNACCHDGESSFEGPDDLPAEFEARPTSFMRKIKSES